MDILESTIRYEKKELMIRKDKINLALCVDDIIGYVTKGEKN